MSDDSNGPVRVSACDFRQIAACGFLRRDIFHIGHVKVLFPAHQRSIGSAVGDHEFFRAHMKCDRRKLLLLFRDVVHLVIRDRHASVARAVAGREDHGLIFRQFKALGRQVRHFFR